MPRSSIYNGRDPRELPAYSFADAARYIDVPPATIRSWVAGRTYPKSGGVGSFEPVIRPADPRTRRLSFYNLVEAHVLRSLRTKHAVPLKHVRPAIAYAEQKMGIPRLLLSKELQTHAGDLFLEHLGSLVNLSKSGQLAIRQMLEAHLQRVEWDDRAIPIRLYPFMGVAPQAEGRPVVIDPNVSFGRPTVRGTGILTSVVVARIDAGESPSALADDYGLTEAQINAAILFERAA
ncbi:MAG TPA: DUF433 domain-containing protein [Longimicrobiaceae bacterium]|nr:DUF433 domain-containing protein [Longimicrobiaceae bacterium]